jgi:hypothetical protein
MIRVGQNHIYTKYGIYGIRYMYGIYLQESE